MKIKMKDLMTAIDAVIQQADEHTSAQTAFSALNERLKEIKRQKKAAKLRPVPSPARKQQ